MKVTGWCKRSGVGLVQGMGTAMSIRIEWPWCGMKGKGDKLGLAEQ